MWRFHFYISFFLILFRFMSSYNFKATIIGKIFEVAIVNIILNLMFKTWIKDCKLPCLPS